MQFKYTLLASLCLSGSIWANDMQLQKQLESIGATHVKISDSLLTGFKTAETDQGILQISEDGRYLIQGKIFELKDGKAVDITHKTLLKELNALAPEMIVFPAKNQKHIITVFTDISCHYCQLFHSKIKEYNELGITVRYLAFPRKGVEHQTAKQMEAIWTDKDKMFAFEQAEKGELPKTLKSAEIVKKHYQLGLKFGIEGTPAMVTETGEVIPGYVEPRVLSEMLN